MVSEMDRTEELERENAALRDRLSRLSRASLRINESLELEPVLQGVLDSAILLTAARFGVMTLMDDQGQIQNLLSSGTISQEALRSWNTPDGIRVFDYLDSLSKPLRVPDLAGVLRSVGLPEFQPPEYVGKSLSFLAAPVRHRGDRVGNIFVAGKEGGDFTLQDEETLVMFASQAAMVISNAHRYRDEQRARNDLETLVNTSPVGVVVFDARTGAVVSINREATRIVESLRQPDQTHEQLLGIITIRRADGREMSLDELPLAEALREAETVRAEEIVMRAPNGQEITALVNATPICDAGGKVESFIVTIQDMAPLEELERLRAEFLAMVSHELRMPLSSIKGSVVTVLGSPSSMERSDMIQFFRIIDLQADRMHELIGDLLDVARMETGTLSIDPKPTNVASLTEEAKHTFVNANSRFSLEVDLSEELPWVMADRDRIVQVLGNLLSDTAKHSPKDIPIRVSAVRDDVHVAISVSAMGRGVPADLLPHLFKKFSRADAADSESGFVGSGLGLAICRGIVEAHGGRIWAESDGPGMGVRLTFTLPTVEMGAVVGPAEATFPTIAPSPEVSHEVRILAVDDDPQTLRYVRDSLSRAGYSPIVTGDPDDVPRLIETHQPHLVLLDMLLPGVDGIELMNTILETADVPVIFLSVYGAEDVIARAFDMGAADYVVKPFSPTELAARIRAALRRRAGPNWHVSAEPFSSGELAIDYAERRVTVEGRHVQLTATEYNVLDRLSRAAGRVLTHDQLLQQVWNPERKGEPWLVRNIIKRLRTKLGDNADSPTYIFTEPRVGYRMAKGEEHA